MRLLHTKKYLWILVFLLLISCASATININSPANNTLASGTNTTINVTITMGNISNVSMNRNGTTYVHDPIAYYGFNNISGIGDTSSTITDSTPNKQSITMSGNNRYVQGYVGTGLFFNATQSSGAYGPITGSNNLIAKQRRGELAGYSVIVMFKPEQRMPLQCSDQDGGGVYSGQSLFTSRDYRQSLGLDEGNKAYLQFMTSVNGARSTTDARFLWGQKAIPYNEYTCLAYTMDNASRTLKLYQNVN